ncbi:HET domain-containing protein [Colletotrichum musicola]|uniref:HET domain-containing protein n=1 Tax=Colletotrichum musicola TaxID=2175873 RepID=A0A8H6J3Y1_9PEZI|nr:HET domain-containing protein [Colletotrichum musicola]
MDVTPAQGPQRLLPYRYELLKHPDSIRVLSGEQLRNPDTSRNYSAISYTWGVGPFSHDLIIEQSSADNDGTSALSSADSTPKLSFLKIKASVDGILRHMRDIHRPVYLWLDALCINQKDDNDKAKQIPQMGEIYKCAEAVHVWLGVSEANEAATAFANIRSLPLFGETETYMTDLCKSLTMLTKESWFTRRWVIQELKLAERAVIHYARHHVEYTRFRAAWYLVESRMLSETGPRDLRPLLNRDSTEDLLELLWRFDRAECSQPKDRIAALYGFIPRSHQPMDLEYNQHGWEEMYRRLAETLINKGALSAFRVILHLFAFGSAVRGNPKPEDTNCPSWVPNWSRVLKAGIASGERLAKNSIDHRMDRPWVERLMKLDGTEDAASLDLGRNDGLSSNEKEKIWLQEAQQDIPFRLRDEAQRHGNEKYERLVTTTRFWALGESLRINWSPVRGGLFGKKPRLILKLPQKQVENKEPIYDEKPKLWEQVLTCLKLVQDRIGSRDVYIYDAVIMFGTPRACLRIMTLFAVVLKSESPLPEWSLSSLVCFLYETFVAGFENPKALAEDQISFLTSIGGLLQNYALVELEPLEIPRGFSGILGVRKEVVRRFTQGFDFGEYALAPWDIERDDILVPCDEEKLTNFNLGEPDYYHWDYAPQYHLVEVAMCLRPTSDKQVYEVSQAGSLSSFKKFASKLSGSSTTYRNLQDDKEYSFPPPQVRKARFLGPAYCLTTDLASEFVDEGQFNRFHKTYRDARVAGFCRPVTIDVV